MGWRSSSPSSSWARCAAASREILDLILTTRSPRTGWSLRGLSVARYRPLRMCRWSMMWSCSTRGIRRRAGVWRDVCRWRDSRAARVLGDRAGPRLRSAACSTARNLAVAVLRLAVVAAVPAASSAAWAPWSGRTGAGGQLDHERSDDAGADDAGDHPGRSAVQPATVCDPAACWVGAPSEPAGGPRRRWCWWLLLRAARSRAHA